MNKPFDKLTRAEKIMFYSQLRHRNTRADPISHPQPRRWGFYFAVAIVAAITIAALRR